MFGGLCPLPLRLGSSNDTDGVTAEQYSRTGSTVACAANSAPFALITLDTTAPAILGYNGLNGVGLLRAPTITKAGVGRVELVWPPSFSDAFETTYGWKPRSCVVTGHGALPIFGTAAFSASGTVGVYGFDVITGNSVDGTFTVKVF